jgi:hypothetical protein
MFQMMKQVYGEEALGCSPVLKNHKHFAQGRDSMEDEMHTSLPRKVRTKLNIQEGAMLALANCCQMVDEVAGAAGISYVLTIKCCLMT